LQTLYAGCKTYQFLAKACRFLIRRQCIHLTAKKDSPARRPYDLISDVLPPEPKAVDNTVQFKNLDPRLGQALQ